jgi:Fur family ferric uptake transcriptional regulator
MENCCEKQEKHSKHRELVFECISVSGDRHLNAEQIYEEVKGVHPGIGVATVYRNLKHLEDAGVIVKSPVGVGAAAVYELAVGEGKHAHHHLICLSCGDIQNLEADLLDEIEGHVHKKNGFKVKNHRLQLYGLCAKCAANNMDIQ